MKRLLLIAMLLAGCGSTPANRLESEVGTRSQALLDANPDVVFTISGARFLSLDLIGRGLNGTSFNGKTLDERALAKVRLSGVSWRGERQKTIHLKGSMLHGTRPSGDREDARAMIGAIFQGELDDGDTLLLRIDGAVAGNSPSDFDVVRYAVSFQAAQGWEPLCGLTQNGAPVLAVPLAGRWDLRQGVSGGGAWIDDPDSFTFACEGFVLAKCVDMGYAPWREGRSCPADSKGASDCTKKISLAPYHQACARMLRADYCGDGTSHTRDGTAVDSYDRIGVRYDSEDWALEAYWNEGGATCLSRLRDPSSPSPACLNDLPACGTPDPSALLASELQH
jgi:hypothetical protein